MKNIIILILALLSGLYLTDITFAIINNKDINSNPVIFVKVKNNNMIGYKDVIVKLYNDLDTTNLKYSNIICYSDEFIEDIKVYK